MSELALEPVRFEGPRVVVRSTTRGDEARVGGFFSRNREHLAPWETHDDEFFTVPYWEKSIREGEEARARGLMQRMIFFEKPDEDFVAGTISLVHITARAPIWQARVGYGIDATKEGRGLMSEALGIAIRYAFDVLNIKRLLAGHLAHNVRSSRTLARAGFVRECYQREYFWVGGRWEDHVETYLLNPKWKAP
jgi:ribosomal-protein-alanine N-acetyltransferase